MFKFTWIVGTGFRFDGGEISAKAREQMANNAIDTLSRTFGGVTVTAGTGSEYRNNETLTEPVLVFVTFAEQTRENIDKARRACEYLKREFEQRCIVFTSRVEQVEFV